MERFQQVMPTGRQGLEWRDDRKVTNGILFVLQPCIPWRDLPESYGPVTVGYNSDNRWRRSGDRSAIPEPLRSIVERVDDQDGEGANALQTRMVDSSSVHAHRDPTGSLRDHESPHRHRNEARAG